jgi:hypothetical protein
MIGANTLTQLGQAADAHHLTPRTASHSISQLPQGILRRNRRDDLNNPPLQPFKATLRSPASGRLRSQRSAERDTPRRLSVRCRLTAPDRIPRGRTYRRVGARLRAGGPVAYCEARAGARLRAHGASPCCACGPWRPRAARQDCLPRPPRILQAIHRPINGLQDQQLGGWAHAPYQRVFISGDQRAGRSRGTMRIRCRRSRLPRVVTARPIR